MTALPLPTPQTDTPTSSRAAGELRRPPAHIEIGRSDLRPTRAVVDLGALRRNLDFVRRTVGPRVGVMAVVKADGYGHGMIPIAREAVRWGVQAIAVATVDEALDLRETRGFEDVPILLAGPSFPADAAVLQKAGVSVAIGTVAALRHHLDVGRRLGAPPQLHLKIDTGMGRFGFAPRDIDFLDLLRRTPDALEGVLTHFSCADGLDGESRAYTEMQRERFESVAHRIHGLGLRPVYHAANSGGVLNHPGAHYELVRPGVILYGASPDPALNVPGLSQVLTLKTRVVSLHDQPRGAAISYGRRYTMPRDGRVAILPIGYGDGVPRSLGDAGGEVLIRGRRAPIAGRVCMDQTLVDVTGIPGVQLGDEAVLYGEQGAERISLEEVARRAGTIPYEISCRLGLRVPRTIVHGTVADDE